MMNYLLVGLGGAIGSMLRVWATGGLTARFGHSFPWGTLFVNVTGSFIIGLLAPLAFTEARSSLPQPARAFLMTGLCGGYTTFSAFSLQTLELARNQQWLYAGSNALLSFTVCLAAVWLGYTCGAQLAKLL